MEIPNDSKGKVLRLIKAGKKIAAIKYVKETFDLSLKDAKSFVEQLDPDLQSADGFRVGKPGSGHGAFTVLLLLGILILGAGIFLVVETWQRIDNSTPVIGQVIELHYSDEQSASPLVRYAWEGTSYEMVGSVSSNPPSYEVGEEVLIYIFNDDPEDATINGFFEVWFFPVFVTGFGVVLIFIGGVGVVTIRNR